MSRFGQWVNRLRNGGRREEEAVTVDSPVAEWVPAATPIEILERSGIPLDWPTLLLGWQGVGDSSQTVTAAQVQSYAMDRIGCGPEEEFDRTARLAFADERDTWTIRACLEQLAPDTPEARDRAERVWRWVALTGLVEDLRQELAYARTPEAARSDPYALDGAVIDVWVDLREFWYFHHFPADRFATVQDWTIADWNTGLTEQRASAILDEHEVFLAEERVALGVRPTLLEGAGGDAR